jgi:predicted transcriptional regulator
MSTENSITLRDLLKKLDRFQKLDLANKCGTSLGYLRKLAYGQCEPSLSMFRKLNAAEPRLTIDSFFRSDKSA